MKLGMNLSSVNYGESDVKCSDLATHGTGWNGAPAGYVQGRFLPSAGYMLPDMQGYRRPGTYTLQCLGNGVLQYADTSYGYPWLQFGEQKDGTYKQSYPIELKGGIGLGSIITVESNPGGDKLGLRDLQLLAPEASPCQLWHPRYLESIAPFTGGLRTYDFIGGTDDTGPGCTWESRHRRDGYGIEAAVDLANMTGRDLHVCLPVHCLTAAGLTDLPSGLGAYLRANLDPSLKVHVAVGDELWNGAAGYGWQLFGYLTGLAHAASPPVDPATGRPMASPWELATYILHAGADAMIAAIGPKGPRIVRVAEGQCTWWGNSDYLLQTWAGREGWAYDAISCAPYAVWPNSGAYTAAAVGALWAAGNTSAAMDLIAAGLDAGTAAVVPYLRQWQEQARIAKVPLHYYEMGLDYSALWSNPASSAAARAFRSSPQAGAVTTGYLAAVAPFAEVGFWLQDCSLDEWGARAHADDTESRIWPALLAYAAANA